LIRTVDSHCHLQVDALRSEASTLWREAQAAGVVDLLIPGIEPGQAGRDVALAEGLDVWCSVGCHPCHPDAWDAAQLSAWTSHPRVVAIGECGLDYFHKPFDAALQEQVFRAQIELARVSDLPLILHNRESDRDLVRILRDTGADRGVFHCFGGDASCLEDALALGFHISFAGNVTYPKALFRDLVRLVPLDRLLVETDAPWLAPVPHRGKTNHPRQVVHVLEEVARLRQEDPATLGEAVVRNFRDCFPRTRRHP